MDINSNIKNRSDLKSYFIKNAIPTESNFAEFIESVINQREDGLVKAPGAPLSIEASGDPSSQKKAINFYSDFAEEKPDWVLSLNPRSDPTKPETARPGLSISNAEGKSRLFVDQATGNVGIGTTNPGNKLEVAGGIKSTGLEVAGDLKVTGKIVAPEGTIRDDNGGWVRTYGPTGWYSQTYGGGWYMTDTTWIRSYASKSIYHNKGIMRTDGTLQVGSSGSTLNVANGGNFAYRTNVLTATTSGTVGIGTAAPAKQLHIQQGVISAPLLNEARRPGIALTGQYPELNLFSRIANVSHGPTIRMGSYDADTGAATKQWVMGTSGRNSRFLDFGFSATTNGNPHNGIRNYSGKTVVTMLENGNVGIGTLEPNAKLEVAGGAFLGYETTLSDFGAPLQSGFYQNGGANVTGDVPDTSHSWSHMIVARHSNSGNNHQLQIASSYAENDRLFFRKIAHSLASKNPAWQELTTLARENSRFKVTSGYVATLSRYSAAGWAGYNDWGRNYAFVNPPSGFTMSHLMGFIASMALVHYAGGVNSDDSIWCKWRKDSTRVRVICNNSENRAGSAINYLAIWRK